MGRTEFELQRVLERGRPRCPVCVFVTDATLRYVDALFYENVNDIAIRDQIRKDQGFCRYHAQMVSRQADALGTAIILKDVLTNVLREVDAGEYARTQSSNPIRQFFAGRGQINERPSCVVCDAENEIDKWSVDALCQALDHEEIATLFLQSRGLCVPHFRLAAERGKSRAAWNLILDVQKSTVRDLVHRLEELAKSYDHHASHDVAAEVKGSWQEALNISSSWIDLCFD